MGRTDIFDEYIHKQDLHNKPFPTGDNKIFCEKPKSTFGMLRNCCEIILAGKKCDHKVYWQIPSKMSKIRRFFYRMAKWLYEKLKPMEFSQYVISVRLNKEETKRLEDAIKALGR